MRRALGRVLLAGVGLVALGGMFEAGRLTGGSAPPAKQGGASKPAGAGGKPGEVTMAAEARRAVGLTLAPVTAAVLRGHLATTARIAADEERTARLRTVGRGRVLSVAVRPGDAVTKGEVLATYDDVTLSDLRAQTATAAAALSDAQAAAAVAREALARGRALEGTVLAPAEVERRRAALAAASSRLAMQQATVADLRRRASLFTPAPGAGGGTAAIVSPLDGYALTVSVSPGDLVEAGAPVATVSDLSDVWVLASVFQADVTRIDAEGRCLVTVPGIEQTVFEAQVGTIGHALDLRTGAAPVRCVVRNPDRTLRIGMLANVALPTRETHSALTVPAGAVQRIDDKPVVFVAEGGDRFHETRIETGLQTADRVVVLRGLDAGAQVVTQGSFALKSQVLQSEISGD